jgi:CheY-like chemotaxis protein
MTSKHPDDATSEQSSDTATLAAAIAHDFNNMLLAVTSCLELIRSRSSEARIVDIAGHGLDTIDRGTKLVERVLALGRLAASVPAKPAVAGEAAALSAPAARPHTVLVVDDDADVRLVLVELLQSLGYELIEAENGPDGIAALDRVPRPDLAIVDLALPGQNGSEVAIELLERQPDLPIIFATGYSGDEKRDPRLSSVPVLHKPFRIAELAQTVATALAS